MEPLLEVWSDRLFALRVRAVYEAKPDGSVDWPMMPGEFDALLRSHEPFGSTWLEAVNNLAVKCMTRWNRLPKRVLLTESGLDGLRSELHLLVRFGIKVPPFSSKRFRLGTGVGTVEIATDKE